MSVVGNGPKFVQDYMIFCRVDKQLVLVIERLFPEAVIFLESALMHYGYTDRIASTWQIGVDKIYIENVQVRIYDRDRTICDILRYEKKLEKEVFNNAIKRYVKDPKKNVRKLFDYAEVLNIKNKTQTYIGVRLKNIMDSINRFVDFKNISSLFVV